MSDNSKEAAAGKPERAHKLIMVVEADSARALASFLFNMSNQIDRGEITTGVSGGYDSGAIYSYKVNPDQTHDAYFQELETYLASLRTASAAAEPAPSQNRSGE